MQKNMVKNLTLAQGLHSFCSFSLLDYLENGGVRLLGHTLSKAADTNDNARDNVGKVYVHIRCLCNEWKRQ